MRFHTKTERREVYSFGIRMGYWPCVNGPFVQVSLGNYYRSVWFGTEEV